MKTFSLFIVLMALPFFSIAQSEIVIIELDKSEISISKSYEEPNMANISNIDIEVSLKKKSLLTNTKEIKQEIAKNSDIRNYINMLRNVSNIEVIFPKMNRFVKA